jgi:hypothetical protein
MTLPPIGPRFNPEPGSGDARRPDSAAQGAPADSRQPAAPSAPAAPAAAEAGAGDAQRWAESLLDGVAWLDALVQATAKLPPRTGAGSPADDATRDSPATLHVPLPLHTPPSPMSLFGPMAEPLPVAPAAPLLSLEELAQHIQTLAVGTDADGHRRVRLTLADHALPGTDVMLSQDGGTLQVDIQCRHDDGCLALQQQAQALADRLAQRLQQAVTLSVGGALPDDPGRVTAWGRPDAGSVA